MTVYNNIVIQDKISEYVLNTNRNLLIIFSAFFVSLGFIISVGIFLKNNENNPNQTKEENVEKKVESSFLKNVAVISFIAVLIVCLYHIYLVYHYQKVINSGKLEYNLEWFFFPLFIILFTGIPLYLYIDEL
jgi:heme/copper-type cytochrome/quinol oxidase subunit 2